VRSAASGSRSWRQRNTARVGGNEAADDKCLARNNKSLDGNQGYMRLNWLNAINAALENE